MSVPLAKRTKTPPEFFQKPKKEKLRARGPNLVPILSDGAFYAWPGILQIFQAHRRM